MEISNVSYDKANKQLVCSLGGQFLTIPDYMTIQDVEYYIADKVYSLMQASMQYMAIQSELVDKRSPLEKARAHYKELGWD